MRVGVYVYRLRNRNARRCMGMPLWLEWLDNHWLPVLLTIGVVIAIVYVIANRKLLFYKE
jgi:hypothetical protein